MATRTLTLAKSGRKFVFRYSGGCEEQVLDQIAHLAADAETPLDWLDAAMLSFQVTQGAAESDLPAPQDAARPRHINPL